ncbi:four-carbon acid sugar kinase family protein [uncultured Microbacterium sp.]|uniref:four-carbon acid sugar kinase family protein n=1 Tax=uncultured Microbacterium sp. TaxID=191216 RepID=UPI0028D0FFAE|nr:four-carbon acid sugar kinase family protein [uncultured Microbacterium sp.]
MSEPASGVEVAYYGDDVTGSVDVLLQFTRLGRRGRLFVGVPDAASLAVAAEENEIVGIAGISRSLRTEDIDAEVRPALEALKRLQPRIVQYKACSTADSSPAIGSIGRVIEIGRDVFASGAVPMLFAQPDFGRYTVFTHHFAADAGVVYRLDRQPTMSTHPSTPMGESDLAVHLGLQTSLPIGALPFTSYSSAEDIASALRDTRAAAVVLDALDDAHLSMLGDAIRLHSRDAAPLFAIGSGGLSRALGLSRTAPVDSAPDAAPAASGRAVLAVSGSRSQQTRRQMDAAARAGWIVRPLPLGPGDGDGASAIASVVAELRAGRSVALTSDDAPHGGADPLAAIARAGAEVIRAAVTSGATDRVVVCGGDTSGRVVRMLGIESVSIVAHPPGNVVVLRAHASAPGMDGVELVLKGGQMGRIDLLEDLRTGRTAPLAEVSLDGD